MSNKKWKNPTYHVIGGKQYMLPQYNQWYDMIQRCTSTRSKMLRKSYENCECEPDWLNYDLYLKWANQQKGFLQLDKSGKIYQIDKDLLGDGLTYDENSCVFIPKVLNQALIDNFKGFQIMKNGSYRVVSSVATTNKKVSLGCYKDYEKSFNILKDFKENQIRSLAIMFKKDVDKRVYDALLKWQWCPKFTLHK